MKYIKINVVLMTLLSVANSSPAQGVSRQLAEGTHLFRRILHDADLKSIPLKNLRGLDARERQDVRYEALQTLRREPEGKILIVLGETRFLDPRMLDDFLNEGGALLVATDRQTSNAFRRQFGMGVSGEAVSVRDDSPSAYLSQGECVYVEAVNKGDGLFEDLPRLATNRPSYLDRTYYTRLRLLALFPEETFINRKFSRNRLPFAAGGDLEAGRILLLADHSIFINAMLWQNDNDNLFFAQNWRWLADGKRSDVLFIEDGEVQTQFDIPLKPPPFPPLDGLVGAVDQGLQSLEEEDRFNRLTRGSIEDLDPDKVLRGPGHGLDAGRRPLRAEQAESDAPSLRDQGAAARRCCPGFGILSGTL